MNSGLANAPARALVCLASRSPRRHELLRQIGVPHSMAAADIDEACRPGEAPRDYVSRLALCKAVILRERGESLPVLAADTTVVLDGIIHGKPADRAEAVAMLSALSGKTHEVLTAVALAAGATPRLRISASAVRFRDLAPAQIEAYCDTGEPFDKAGAYAIQGFGAVFVEALTGSYSGVMGLPLFETAQLLGEAGIGCWIAEGAP